MADIITLTPSTRKNCKSPIAASVAKFGPAPKPPAPPSTAEQLGRTALVLALTAGICDAQPDLSVVEAAEWAEMMLAEMPEQDRPTAADLLALAGEQFGIAH